MLEFQITKEYLGFTTHLAYLGTMFEETLASDTFAHGPARTVARVIDGSLDGHRLTGMAGVPTSAPTATGRARTSTRRTGTRSVDFAWNPRSKHAKSPTNGCE